RRGQGARGEDRRIPGTFRQSLHRRRARLCGRRNRTARNAPPRDPRASHAGKQSGHDAAQEAWQHPPVEQAFLPVLVVSTLLYPLMLAAPNRAATVRKRPLTPEIITPRTEPKCSNTELGSTCKPVISELPPPSSRILSDAANIPNPAPARVKSSFA